MNDVKFSIEVFKKTFDKAAKKTIFDYSKMLAEECSNTNDLMFGLLMGEQCALILSTLKKNLFNDSEEK